MTHAHYCTRCRMTYPIRDVIAASGISGGEFRKCPVCRLRFYDGRCAGNRAAPAVLRTDKDRWFAWRAARLTEDAEARRRHFEQWYPPAVRS